MRGTIKLIIDGFEVQTENYENLPARIKIIGGWMECFPDKEIGVQICPYIEPPAEPMPEVKKKYSYDYSERPDPPRVKLNRPPAVYSNQK